MLGVLALGFRAGSTTSVAVRCGGWRWQVIAEHLMRRRAPAARSRARPARAAPRRSRAPGSRSRAAISVVLKIESFTGCPDVTTIVDGMKTFLPPSWVVTTWIVPVSLVKPWWRAWWCLRAGPRQPAASTSRDDRSRRTAAQVAQRAEASEAQRVRERRPSGGRAHRGLLFWSSCARRSSDVTLS